LAGIAAITLLPAYAFDACSAQVDETMCQTSHSFDMDQPAMASLAVNPTHVGLELTMDEIRIMMD
jgi:hypothetical protein